MLDAETVATLGIALACVAAFGTIATTMESSVSTHPDDVVDLDYEKLPIGQDRAEDLKKQYQGDSPADDADEGSTSKPADEGEKEGEVDQSSKKQSEASGANSDPSGDDEGQTGGSGEGEGTGPAESLLQQLLSLLRALLPVVVLLALAAAAYRYRDRLLAALAALFGGAGGSGGEDGDAVEWDPGEPSNPVHAAWVELLRRTDLERPHARTPEECRDAAIEAGHDPDAVRRLTRVFRDVRYGDRPVTDDRVQRARESLDRILGSDAGDGDRQFETLGRIERGDST